MYTKVLGAIFALLIVVAAYGVYERIHLNKELDRSQTPKEGWLLYKSDLHKFSVQHLQYSGITEGYYFEFPGSSVRNLGVAFPMPTNFIAGTNLASDSRTSIEVSKECNPVVLVSNPNVKEFSRTIGGYTFRAATSSDAGAGNFYEEHVYATVSPRVAGECYVGRLFLHSMNLGIAQDTNPETLLYDRARMAELFEEMLSTLYLWKK